MATPALGRLRRTTDITLPSDGDDPTDLDALAAKLGGGDDPATTSAPPQDLDALAARLGGGDAPAAGRAAAGGPRGQGGPGGRLSGPGASRTGNPEQSYPTPGGMARDTGTALIHSITEPYDPRNATGRQNLVATGAGVATTALASKLTGPFAPLVQIAAPIVMSGLAGGGEAAAEGDPDYLRAGVLQSINEFIGGTLGITERWIGRRAVAGNIARNAQRELDSELTNQRLANRDVSAGIRARVRQDVEAQTILKQAEIDAAKTRAATGVDHVRSMVEGRVTAARTAGDRSVANARASTSESRAVGLHATRAARVQAAEAVAQTELDNAGRLHTIASDYDAILGAPPSRLAPGENTAVVIGPQGPAQQALRTAGERVKASAQTGPPIAVAPLQAELDNLLAGARPSVFAQAADGGQAAQVADLAAAGMHPDAVAAIQAQLGAQGIPPTHPISGVLGQLRGVTEPTISFADAHKLKELLDQNVNWDATSKKHVERITKALRNTLRDQLAVHEPYNQATAAYAHIVPLYEKGVGRALKQAIRSGNPDRVAALLDPAKPASARNLKRLLVDMSAAGGDRAVGEHAWDSVVDTFTHDKIVRGEGGLGKLTDRVHNLLTQSPEFAATVFNTPERRQQLGRYVELGEAFTAAQAAADARLAAQREAGRAAVQGVRAAGDDVVAGTRTNTTAVQRVARAGVQAATRSGRQELQTATREGTRGVTTTTRLANQRLSDVRSAGAEDLITARHAGADATREIQSRIGDLRASSIGPYMKEDRALEDAAHAAVAVGQVGKFWGTYNMLRLLRGPRQADLLQYMAASPARTQMAVRFLQSRLPDRAAAAFMREILSRPEAQQPASEKEIP